MSEKKVVELKELPENKIRLFRSREEVTVDMPNAIVNSDKVDDETVPVSITIRPMSHREAEVRNRLRRNVDVAMAKTNMTAGISDDDMREFISDKIKIYEMMGKDEFTEQDIEDTYKEFKTRWKDLIYKDKTKDMSEVYKAEDELRENSVECVCNNCISINFKHGITEINADTIDCIHPDLFWWILTEIESISYLKQDEVVGFR